MPVSVAAIIPAAGAGTRLGNGTEGATVAKAFRELAGRSMLARSIDALAPYVDQIVVAVPPGARVAGQTASHARVELVDGGETRQQSVRHALAAVDTSTTWVLVHDAARPLVPGEVVRRVLAALAAGAACVVPVIAPPDSLRRVTPDGGSEPAPRDRIRLVQTPQGFTMAALRWGHQLAVDNRATDDATLVEATGTPVVLVDGDPVAFKVTRPLDLLLAEALLARSPDHPGPPNPTI